MQNVLFFTGFEQHWVMWCVHLRTVGSAECVVVFAGFEQHYAPIWGLLGVQNVLIFTGFEQHWVILRFHPRIVGSVDVTVFLYMLWATCNLLSPSGEYSECRIYWYLQVWGNIESSSISIWGLLGARPFTEELHTLLQSALVWGGAVNPMHNAVHNPRA